MRTIYTYFCNAGYPHRLQDGIDTTIKILSTMDNSYLEIEKHGNGDGRCCRYVGFPAGI